MILHGIKPPLSLPMPYRAVELLPCGRASEDIKSLAERYSYIEGILDGIYRIGD